MCYKNYHKKNIIGLSLFHYKLYKIGNILYKNRNKKINKYLMYLCKIPYKITSILLNCYIPFSVEIGDGLVLPHGFFGIFISKKAQIGKNVLIFHQVTIGSNEHTCDKDCGAPKIGNNVFIGAGAKIIGNIKLGNNVKIGANAIVINNVEDRKTVVSPKGIIL